VSIGLDFFRTASIFYLTLLLHKLDLALNHHRHSSERIGRKIYAKSGCSARLERQNKLRPINHDDVWRDVYENF